MNPEGIEPVDVIVLGTLEMGAPLEDEATPEVGEVRVTGLISFVVEDVETMVVNELTRL